MDEATRAEYEALRATIRERGTARVALAWVTLVAWAALAAALVIWAPWPALFLTGLLVLAAGYEAVYALHVGVERIGRYVQVFHEPAGAPAPGLASWEHAAVAYGERYQEPGPDPLFTPLFLAAAALNVFWVAVIAVPLESVSLGAIHLAFAIRLLVGRQRAGRVRARDLQRFRDLRP